MFPHHSEETATVSSSELDVKQQPYAYLSCGHVQGRHEWGLNKDSNNRTCPMCLKVIWLIIKIIVSVLIFNSK